MQYDIYIYKVKLLLLHLVVKASRYVAPYVQVSGSYLSPKWIGSCKYMIYAENI